MLSRRSLFRGAAAARAKGMTDAQYTEALAVIVMASQTNALAMTLGVEVDERFRV
jgi:alkylhydroperoxidase family enzyme